MGDESKCHFCDIKNKFTNTKHIYKYTTHKYIYIYKCTNTHTQIQTTGAVLHYMSQYSFCWDSVGMDIKDLESVGMDPNRSAPLRASTSPPPPLAYFQHIKLSVPKRKI